MLVAGLALVGAVTVLALPYLATTSMLHAFDRVLKAKAPRSTPHQQDPGCTAPAPAPPRRTATRLPFMLTNTPLAA